VEALAAHHLPEAECVAPIENEVNDSIAHYIVAARPGEYTVKWDGTDGIFGLKLKWNQMQFVVCGFTAEAAMKDAAQGFSAASVFIGSVITAINGISTAGRSYTGAFCPEMRIDDPTSELSHLSLSKMSQNRCKNAKEKEF
jgi:hypothetical protein